MNLVLHHIKLVRIANKLEFGWETDHQYDADVFECLPQIQRTISKCIILKGEQR